jgi:alpha-N-acetylglucosaminidase
MQTAHAVLALLSCWLLLAALCERAGATEAPTQEVVARASSTLRRTTTPPNEQVRAVEGLIDRLLGASYRSLFHLGVLPPDHSEHDHYTLSTRTVGTTTQVRITASSGVALASGLHWYLKYYCNCSVSWGVHGSGNNLVLPSPLPGLSTPLTMTSPVKYRYYLNVCTHSYSSVWWQWDRWEQEIDWMALHGINLPLSSTGQEYIFAEVFKSLGLNETDLEGFFVGPAFLAWGRMGNIQGWGGPLDPAWRQAQAALQKRIVERQRLFGMLPILPAFAGFVPGGIQRIYPEANLTRSADWAGFPAPYANTYFLSPLDPLYKTIGRMVVRQTMSQFGTDHIYNADTFNEMSPPSADPAYLASASRAVYEGMAAEDPQALWVMQGWSFVFDKFWTKDRIRSYLSGVKDTDLLILDLASDNSPEWSKTDSYFGKEFVWCMLHNGGGVRGLYGNLTQYSTDPLLALATPNNTMVGVGMTMEAIEQNPIVYELMSEMGWRSQTFNISEWVQRYAQRRYGTHSKSLGDAWEQLREATYEQSGLDSGLFGFPPGLGMGWGGTSNATQEVAALRLFLQSAQTKGFTPNGPWRYDCVDLTRQVLANTFRDVYAQLDTAYTAYSKNQSYSLDQFQRLGAALLELIADINTILATDPNYLLGPWIESALSWAATPDQIPHYQFNARNQITLWGPDGQISDYATKHWAGLLSTYYLPRWNYFVTFLLNAVSAGKPFDGDRFGTVLMAFEQQWNRLNTTYPTTPEGDTLRAANALATKYLDASEIAHRYRRVARTDAWGPNVMDHPTWSRDLAQLMWLCHLNPLCLGFNTHGYLKANVTRQEPNATVDLYIKISTTTTA